MKKSFLSLIFIFLASLEIQSQGIIQRVVKVDNKYYLQGKNKLWEVVDSVITVKPLKDINDLRTEITPLHTDQLGYITVRVPKGISVYDYVELLKSTAEFETVEYDCIAHLCLYPNDYNGSTQSYINTINARDAWDITMGNPNVKVAIIDSGIDSSHVDLGYGYDTYSNLNTTQGWNYMTNSQYSPPQKRHGTRVAGIIGAKSNNNIGICGIAGGNHSKGVDLISYCITDTTDFPQTYVATAINNAVISGAKIINLSFDCVETSSINAAIENAYSNNVSIVCSSGNDSLNTISYPASHPKTIAVGAIGIGNIRETSSNYGQGLDLVTPGHYIYTTGLNNQYDQVSGTSVAAPQVSGAIALMLSINPDLTPSEIRCILRHTCKKIPSYTYTNGWNEEVGYGLLDVEVALLSLKSIEGPSIACGPATYTIPNLSIVYDISWHFNGTVANPLDSLIHVDYMPKNQCLIDNSSNVRLYDTLVAVISRYGQPLVTLRKPVYANLSKNLWYSQTPGVPNKYHYPTIPETYFDATQHELLTINPECYITLRCPRFKCMNITSTGTSGGCTRIDDETIQFKATRPPVGINQGLVTIYAAGVNGCNNFTIDIEVQKANILLQPSLSYSIDGDNLILSISKPESSEEGNASETNNNWDILIEEVQSGRILVTGLNLQLGSSRSINTTGWSPGIYTIRATNGIETLTKKVVIK